MMHAQQNMDDRGKKAKRARQGALVLVLGLLGLLAVITTVNAYVTKAVHTTLTDFDQGTFTYTGLVDLPDIESVQLLPIGVAGGGWTELDQTLVEALANFVAVATDGRIYVAGGTKSDLSLNERSWVAEVNPSDGSLGDWQEQEPMPIARKSAGFAVHELNETTSMLYVVGGFVPNPEGGFPAFVRTNTILSAHIDRGDPPSLTGWEEEAQQLPVAIQNPSVVVHGDALYVVGGRGTPPEGEDSYNKVLYAPINSDGSLGAFVETFPLTSFEPLTGSYYGLAVAYDGDATDTLYFIGGLRNDDSTATIMVQFADFAPGGGLTEWTSFEEGNLVLPLWGHSGVYLSDASEYGEILLVGGIENAGQTYEPEDVSRVVKVALVDPTSYFRLYDWCEGVSGDLCDIGAWQTGTLLDEDLAQEGKRAFHVTVAVGDYIYVLGGQGVTEEGTNLEAKDTIFVGELGSVEAMYAPQGSYESIAIDLEQPATLLQLEWTTTIAESTEMSLTLQYRYQIQDGAWSNWTDPVNSLNGSNVISITSPSSHPENIRMFQYRADLSTRNPLASPRLDSVQLYYEVPDPDLAVTKDTGMVISVPLGSNLVYNIRYENNGGWAAENAELTEILPENTTFLGPPGWEQVPTTNMYTYQLGDVPWGTHGYIPFEVQVDYEVPENTHFITNEVRIDYPPMEDIWHNEIIDPFTDDNVYKLSTELNIQRMVDLTIADLVWEPTTVITGMWPTFYVSVTNIGTAGALPRQDELGFWVELYIKPAPSDPPDGPYDHDLGYFLDDDGTEYWRSEYVADVNHLLAGESVEVPFPALGLEPSPDFPDAGTYDIYAQVDVAIGDSDPDLGRYTESNETNNIMHHTMVVFTATYPVYLPLVLRDAP